MSYLKIICRKTSSHYFEVQTDRFLEHCKAQAERKETDAYWKDESCTVISVQFDCEVSENMKDAIRLFFASGDLVCNETEDDMEFAVYSTIPEMIQDDKIFLTLYIKK